MEEVPLAFAQSLDLMALNRWFSMLLSTESISETARATWLQSLAVCVRPLTALALRSRFDKARKAAGISFQFRDIRAKTASDTGDLGHSQRLLGHKHRDMTEHYVRERNGQRVKPLR